MQVHEILTSIRKSKQLKIQELHDRIKKIFGKKAVSYRSLLRILWGHTHGRESSLYQICYSLGISPKDLKTQALSHADAVEFIKRSLRKDKYFYNSNVTAEILTGDQRSFLAMEMVLKAKGKTKLEKRSNPEEKREKWVYNLSGTIIAHIAGKKYKTKKGDCLSFNSGLENYLENIGAKKARCLIVETPRPQR